MNNIRRKLLIITTYFPPVQSVASQRIVSFVKYLSPEKYDIKVLAWSDEPAVAPVFPGISFEVIYLSNPQLLKRSTFKKQTSYFHHKVKAFYNICLSVAGINEMSGWGRLADAEITRIQHDWKPDFILATYPYAEALRVGMRNARKLGIPMIADLRDGIVNNSSHRILARFRLFSLEKQVMQTAQAILTVSAPLIEYLKQHYQNLNPDIRELRNGFDFAPGNSGSFNEVFTITYAGTFYGGRKPGQFFEAIKSLLIQGRIKKLRIRFPGVVRNFHVPKELEGFCEFLPRIPYDKIVQILKESDALLMVLDKSSSKGVYSAKIFDYLGAMRPIIAIVDKEDVAARLIQDCRAGFIAGFDDVSEIAKAITGALELWENKQLPECNISLIKTFHRKDLAQGLESLLDELSEKHE